MIKVKPLSYPSVVWIFFTLLSLFLSNACNSPPKINEQTGSEVPILKEVIMAKEGDVVSVHYHGTLDDGQVFDSSRTRGEPLTFTVGSGQVIPGFNNAVLGLDVGGIIKVRMEAADAYGEKNEQLVFDVPLEGAPEGIQEGDRVQLSNGAPAIVVSITEKTIKLDANHQLAGKALTFEIELMSIN